VIFKDLVAFTGYTLFMSLLVILGLSFFMMVMLTWLSIESCKKLDKLLFSKIYELRLSHYKGIATSNLRRSSGSNGF